MTLGGLILAAGRSSRMGDFKPFMTLNGFTMLEMTAGSMRNAGVTDLCVVAGRNAAEVKAAAGALGATCVENAEYMSTDMFTSVKLGLARLTHCDAVLVLPVDIPLAAPATFGAVIDEYKKTGAPVVFPVFQNERAHPPLISSESIPKILEYSGDRGLRGALDALGSAAEVVVDDEGSSLDADTQEQFEKLRALARARTGVSETMCVELFEEFALLPNIREHTRRVAVIADAMARSVISHGHPLDLALTHSGARLHDLLRLEPHHGAAAADMLAGRGYLALADVVREHMNPELEGAPSLDEAALVYIADKLVRNGGPVTIEQRYTPALEHFANDTEATARVQRAVAKANAIKQLYEELTHENLYEQCRDLFS